MNPNQEMSLPARILIVWNDPAYERMLHVYLERDGYMVHSVSSFHEGVTACLSYSPNLLIVERNIERTNDGLELCMHLRSKENLAHLPVIVGQVDNTASERMIAYQEAFEAGANACFGLVFLITDLQEEIKRLLANPGITHLADWHISGLNQPRKI